MVRDIMQGRQCSRCLAAIAALGIVPQRLLATGTPAVASAEQVLGSSPGAAHLIQFTLGLLAVLLAVVALAWLMKRVSRLQFSVGGSLRALGGLSLGPRERVVLVQVGDTQLLLGVAAGRVQTLHVLEQPIEINETTRPATKFSARLSEAMRKRQALSRESS